MLELNKIYNMDCIKGMKQIDDNSIDMVLCDLPYGTTRCKWDSIIPLDKLWEQYKRIIKNKSAIVLTASQPFTSILVNSNLDMFKYEWIWIKTGKNTGNFLNASFMPMKNHESILIFGNGKSTYNPQPEPRMPSTIERIKYKEHVGNIKDGAVWGKTKKIIRHYNSKNSCPRSFQFFKVERGLHPTQKPLTLFKYLIKTYSNDGDIVFDSCMGSGTTAVACKQLDRRFIGFEISKEYYDIAKKRLKNVPERLEKFVN